MRGYRRKCFENLAGLGVKVMAPKITQLVRSGALVEPPHPPPEQTHTATQPHSHKHAQGPATREPLGCLTPTGVLGKLSLPPGHLSKLSRAGPHPRAGERCEQALFGVRPDDPKVEATERRKEGGEVWE